jgi:hypothetical protein
LFKQSADDGAAPRGEEHRQLKIRPGRLVPTMGPVTGFSEKAFTSKPRIEKFTISPVRTPPGKGATNPSKTPALPLINLTEVSEPNFCGNRKQKY